MVERNVQRAEIIDGVIYDIAPPRRIHQKLVMEISAMQKTTFV